MSLAHAGIGGAMQGGGMGGGMQAYNMPGEAHCLT